MVIEPIDYSASTGRALLQGLTAGSAIQGIRQTSQEMDAAKAAAERQKLFYTALQNTPQDQLHKLRTEFPEYAENVQKEIGIQDAEHASFVNKALNNLSVAYASGNPQMMQQAIQAGSPALASMNVPADEAWQLYQSDPQQFGTLLNATRYATMPIEKQVDKQQEQQKIDETARNNRESNAVQWANNNIAQQNVNLRRMELNDKKFDRQIANETNAIRLADLQDKRQQNQQAIEQAKRDKVNAYNTSMDTLTRTVDTANKVLDSPGFTGYFGTNLNPLSSRYIPGTDAADTQALVETLQSQGFLSGIQQMKGLGGLSNAEGEKVMAAVGSLKPGQSEKSAKAAIKTIVDTTNLAKTRLSQRYGKDIEQYQQSDQQQTQQQQAPSQALQALQSNPSLAPQFKAKYGYLPQGFQ